MKASISKGGDFRGLCRYVFDVKGKGDKRPEVIGGTIAGATCDDMIEQFAAIKRIRRDIPRPVWHCSLSFPHGEHPDSGKLAEVAEAFMKLMGFPESIPYTVIRHHDKKHDHIHIVASRIGIDGKVWNAGFDVFKALRATQALEERFGLKLTKAYEPGAKRKGPKFGERQMERRTGLDSPKARLQGLIDEVSAVGPTAVAFCEYLEANGVETRANLARTGRLNGFSFSVEGIAFKGSNLGKDYTWAGLQKRGVTYDPGSDLAGLARFAAGTAPDPQSPEQPTPGGNEGGAGERAAQADKPWGLHLAA